MALNDTPRAKKKCNLCAGNLAQHVRWIQNGNKKPHVFTVKGEMPPEYKKGLPPGGK